MIQCSKCSSTSTEPVLGNVYDFRYWYRCFQCGREFVVEKREIQEAVTGGKEIMTQHTPGPWSVGYDGPSLPIIDSHEGFIAFVKQPDDDATEANARLIAAAPDLLEALHGCEDFVALAPSNLWTERAITNTLGKLRAAIARAEGRVNVVA